MSAPTEYETIRDFAYKMNTHSEVIRAFLKKNNITLPTIDGVQQIGDFERKRIHFALVARGKMDFGWTKYHKKLNIRQDYD